MPDPAFAADLETLRLRAGLTLRALVRATGIPRSTLSDALGGRRLPRLETVLAVVRVCGADPDPWRRRWAALARPRRRPVGALPRSGAARPVPAQLPHDVAGFASREAELARLDGGGIVVVHGRPGVGKTALAVHWAHSVAGRYPEGQLFLNLRGHHPTLAPMPAVEAMGRLLGALEVSWAPVSGDPDEGTNLWRSAVAGRRLLIVLDDAVDAEQVRPLLPGANGCAVVVTSRHYLADLVVRDGADSIVLDVLPADGSLALLADVAGPARVAGERKAAEAVARACGYLPLALRLAGAVLAGAPDRTFAELVDDLAGGDRLSALEGLARPSTVESAFELSYRRLPGAARFLFRRLGLHPGPNISVPVAALLAEIEPTIAEQLLGVLAEAHLVEPGRAGRYRMHDLLHDYAARLVEAADGAEDRQAARRRLFDWYVDRALAVSDRLDAGGQRLWVLGTLRSTWEAGEDEATNWVRAEHRNVVAAIEYDAGHGTGRYAWTLVDLLTVVLCRWEDVSSLTVAVDAALAAVQRHGDRHVMGTMYQRRGWLRWRGAQSVGAAADFAAARELFHDVGARRAEAAALRGLSTSQSDSGRPAEARRHAEQALAIYRAEDDRAGQAATLNSLAIVAVRSADFAATTQYLEASLALHRQDGNHGYAAMALANLSDAYRHRAALARAVECAREALQLGREIGDGFAEAIALVNGAEAYGQVGSLQEAYQWATAAVDRSRQLGYQIVEAVALDALATAAQGLGRDDAGTHRTSAIRCARQAGDLSTEAELIVGAARDGYRLAVGSPADPAFRAARDAAQRALVAGLAANAPHAQAQSYSLLAACNLGMSKVADALAEARQAIEMHVAAGARLAEIPARCVLAHALFRSDDEPAAQREWRVARDTLDQLAVPEAAPVRRLVESSTASSLPPFA